VVVSGRHGRVCGTRTESSASDTVHCVIDTEADAQAATALLAEGFFTVHGDRRVSAGYFEAAGRCAPKPTPFGPDREWARSAGPFRIVTACGL
jgi:hypothetical protein